MLLYFSKNDIEISQYDGLKRKIWNNDITQRKRLQINESKDCSWKGKLVLNDRVLRKRIFSFSKIYVICVEDWTSTKTRNRTMERERRGSRLSSSSLVPFVIKKNRLFQLIFPVHKEGHKNYAVTLTSARTELRASSVRVASSSIYVPVAGSRVDASVSCITCYSLFCEFSWVRRNGDSKILYLNTDATVES